MAPPTMPICGRRDEELEQREQFNGRGADRGMLAAGIVLAWFALSQAVQARREGNPEPHKPGLFSKRNSSFKRLRASEIALTNQQTHDFDTTTKKNRIQNREAHSHQEGQLRRECCSEHQALVTRRDWLMRSELSRRDDWSSNTISSTSPNFLNWKGSALLSRYSLAQARLTFSKTPSPRVSFPSDCCSTAAPLQNHENLVTKSIPKNTKFKTKKSAKP